MGTAKVTTSLLLIFNSAGAVYGGGSLILHPDGSGLGMGPEWLQYSPFSNYMIPGMILLLANGVFGIVCLVQLWRNTPDIPKWIAAQGIVLGGWLLVQIVMLRTVNAMHATMGLTAMGLLVCALWLHNTSPTNHKLVTTTKRK